MYTFDGSIQTVQDWLAVAIFVLCAAVSGPLSIREGRKLLASWRPKRSSYGYRRTLVQINLLNLLRGVPEQDKIYEWQWHLRGRLDQIMGALLLVCVPVGLYLLLR